MAAFGVRPDQRNDLLGAQNSRSLQNGRPEPEDSAIGGPGGGWKPSGMAPSCAQQLAIAALNHRPAIAHEAMRLVAKTRVVPVGDADQSPTEQGGRDFKMGCLLFPAIEASQHVAKAPALGRGQAGVGKVLPVDRADEPLDGLQPFVRRVVQRYDGGERFTWLRVAEKRQLCAARPHMKADLVTPARGQLDAGGAALARAQFGRSLDKVDDPRVNLRRPIDGLLDRGPVRPGGETANPSARVMRASP